MEGTTSFVAQAEASSSSHDTKVALTPPTSEEWNNKAEESGSDALSDLEMDDEIEEEIEPDHYYEGGKIPVFMPTMEQFRSFKSYIGKINKYGMKSGIVKVIPPKEWRDSLPPLDEAVKTIKVKNPITQEFSGTHGTYTQANIEKQRSYNLPQWKALTDEPQHQPPARRGEKRKNTDKVARPATRSRPAAAAVATGSSGTATSEAGLAKRRPGRPRKNLPPPPPARLSIEEVERTTEDDVPQAPPTPTSPDTIETSVEESKRKGAKTSTRQIKQESTPEPRKASRNKSGGGGRSSKTMTISERRKYNRSEKTEQVDEAAFQDFDYRFDAEEFTAERCNELETQYWKSLTFAPPMYGADMPGSLFDDSTTSWNVSKLENLLDVLGQKVPGVNTAYLYLGMWKATFAWHLEDVDLYSINYIHFGAPKQWYSISQEDARRFETAMKNVWPTDAKNCSQFLRHKTYLISPALLKSQYNIEVNKLVHYEGEFVITYPYGYHSGYNLGYNCAESVNFATEEWLEFGRIAKKCDCEADSVWINVEEIERKLRCEPTPEYDEVTDDEGDLEETITDLPSPPASVAGKPKPSRKRKRDTSTLQAQPEQKVKRIKIRIRTSSFEPCVLCPNNLPSEPLLPTDSGKHAHRACALYTPETYLAEENGVEKVLGVANIDKARLDLKCSFCRSKKGACFQCSSRKCTRAFHATCAAPAGVQVDYGPTPVYGEDGTEYISEGHDFRCRFHRAKRPKNITSEILETSSLVKKFARALRTHDTVQVQYIQGDVFAGIVVENRPSERTLVVDILPDGDRIEVEWKWLAVLDPADSQLPRPTADAKLLPAHMNGQMTASRSAEFGPPVPGDHFLDPTREQKWAEFNTAPAPRNGLQTKVNLDKENQIWHYLGKTSTEARAQFTEDPTKLRFNPAGNFLDTVKPVVPSLPPAPRRPTPATQPPGVNYHAQNAAMVHARQQSISQGDQLARPYQYKPRVDFSPGSGTHQQIPQNGISIMNYSQAPLAPMAWKPPPSMHMPTNSSSNLGTLHRGGGWLDTSSFQRRQSSTDSAYLPQIFPPSFNAGQRSVSTSSSHGIYDNSNVPLQTSRQSWGPSIPSKQMQGWNLPQGPQTPQTPRTPQAPQAPQATMARTAPMPNMSAPIPNMTSNVSATQLGDGVGLGESGKEGEFLKRIESYKYLLNSYCRRPKIYVSPYPTEEGFSDEYSKVVAKSESAPTPVGSHYQECALPLPILQHSLSSLSQQQESPSSSAFTYQMYPQLHHPRSQYGQYQTPQQFEQQVKRETSGGQEMGTGYERLFKQMAASAKASEHRGEGLHRFGEPVQMQMPQVQRPQVNMRLVEPSDLTLGYQ